jgi:trehalose utilization protein
MEKIRVTVWNEFRHEKKDENIKKIYPKGIHEQIAQHLRKCPDLEVRTATLDEPDHGLSDEVLKNTDVLVWWGHTAHDQVRDDIVDKIQARILQGMGLVVLHSGHHSKIFKRMMGSSCSLTWREVAEKSHIWVVNAYHPIAKGIDSVIELEHEEMYGEIFDVPDPDELIFISWFEGGEVFRSGMTWRRGRGKIFYFQPGHETYPQYKNPEILKVIENAVRYLKFNGNTEAVGIGGAPNVPFTLNPVKK